MNLEVVHSSKICNIITAVAKSMANSIRSTAIVSYSGLPLLAGSVVRSSTESYRICSNIGATLIGRPLRPAQF